METIRESIEDLDARQVKGDLERFKELIESRRRRVRRLARRGPRGRAATIGSNTGVGFATCGAGPAICGGRGVSKPLGPGDLFTVELDAGEYRVVKILAMEGGIVHVRLYADKFVERPFNVEPAQLDLAALGIPHLPVSAEDFATWRPGVVGHEVVQAAELEGYELWREAYERSLSRSGRARA